MTRYRIYGVDRAGNSWEAAEVHEAFSPLAWLARFRRVSPENLYRIVDADNEDHGDMEARLQGLADGG